MGAGRCQAGGRLRRVDRVAAMWSLSGLQLPQRIRVFRCYAQQGSRRAGRFPTALLPILQRAHRYAEQCSEGALGEPNLDRASDAILGSTFVTRAARPAFMSRTDRRRSV